MAVRPIIGHTDFYDDPLFSAFSFTDEGTLLDEDIFYTGMWKVIFLLSIETYQNQYQSSGHFYGKVQKAEFVPAPSSMSNGSYFAEHFVFDNSTSVSSQLNVF